MGGQSAERRGRETPPYTLTAAAFAFAIDCAKADLRGIVPRFCDQLREILTLRQALMVQPQPHAGLERDLAALLPPDFLRTTPYAQLAHFPRYLKAMKLRAERWRQNPVKDAERAAQLAPYVAAVVRLEGVGAVPAPRPGGKSGEATRRTPDPAEVGALRRLVEEFRVSLFAQELGTAEPVSAVKLDRALAAMQGSAVLPPTETAPLPKPIVSASVGASVGAKKTVPLKNLGALDKLFPR